VTVVDGAKVLTPFKGQEELHLGNVGPIVGLRLACQARFACDGEVRIDVPPVDDVQARKRRKVERFREAAGKGTSVAPERVERQPKVEWRPRKLEAQALATLAPPAASHSAQQLTPDDLAPATACTASISDMAASRGPAAGGGCSLSEPPPHGRGGQRITWLRKSTKALASCVTMSSCESSRMARLAMPLAGSANHCSCRASGATAEAALAGARSSNVLEEVAKATRRRPAAA
jgi:hypothetical protein